MKKTKISNVDVLSAVVFIPDSPLLGINLIRRALKSIFRLMGKIAALFLL
jgi:hypothetical protein